MGYKDACDNQAHKYNKYSGCNSRAIYGKNMVFKWQLCKEKNLNDLKLSYWKDL